MGGGPSARAERRHRSYCASCAVAPECPFASLGPEARAAFESILETRVYSPGSVILGQGDPARDFYILRSGLARTTHVTAAGKSVGGHVLGPPAFLGLTEVVTGDRYLLGAEAVDACTLGHVTRKDFAPFLLHHPEAALALLIQVSQDLAKLQAELFEAAGGECLTGRLLGELRELAGSCGIPTDGGVLLDVPLTVRDLAGTLGCSRQWASKLLGELGSRGLIERRGRRILLTRAALGMAEAVAS